MLKENIMFSLSYRGDSVTDFSCTCKIPSGNVFLSGKCVTREFTLIR